MNLVGITCSGADANRSQRPSHHRSTPARPHHIKRTRQPQPVRTSPKPRRVKQRRVRCDCGQLAITVLLVRVGSDPQYTVHLPLCPACLNLEQELHASPNDK